ncbi:MAG: helix-hairpin-helix domain-containing protein, partial [Ignavibacteria bacterium]|nr:helix-hairpin-helix domain-containing protein [Ignavibacteria bacterium]
MKIYLIIFFLITPELLSQTGGDTIESPEIETESLLESGTEDVEDSELLDRIIWLKDNPIELNTATAEDLLQIPYLDALMTRNILQYRRRIESFSSVSQLKNVDGMDEGLYNRIVSFLYVKDSQLDYIKDEYGDVRKAREELKRGLLGRVKLNLRSRFSNDLQPAAGYLNGRYFGTKPKVYNRLGVIYSASGYKFSGSLLTEKDAGEKSLADHVAGYVEMKSPLVLSQFLLGDYTLEFGQGITLWGAYSFSKGIEAVSSVRKKGSGINSYTSVNEVQFFRGGAFRFDYAVFSGNKLSLWGFYSNNYINASVDTTLDEFSSLYTDGYHRTESEINRKNSGKEIFYGGRLQFESQKFSSSKVGITYYRSKFSKPFKYKGVYEFYGDRSNA